VLKVVVKLFASLRNAGEKELTLEVDEASTVLDIIDILEIPMENVAIIMINGRRKEAGTEIFNHDIVSLFPPVGGG